MTKRVLVAGGAGYIGGVLIPKLLAKGYEVVVYDLYIYGDEVFEGVRPHPRLTEIHGDVRDTPRFRDAVAGCDACIHLACISNDPSCDLDPNLSRTINLESFPGIVDACNDAGVARFVFASSSSVYGISDSPRVDEDHPRIPITDYNRYKSMCEDILAERAGPRLHYTVIRPATVCGYSPRLRLDLSVNILASQAITANKVTIFGGSQYRPNLHIQDMTDLYLKLLEEPLEKVSHRTFNAGYQNMTIADIAQIVKTTVEERRPGTPVTVVATPSNDLRSYRITCDRLRNSLGFEPKYTIADAVNGLYDAFAARKIPDAATATRYVNIKRMREIGLK